MAEYYEGVSLFDKVYRESIGGRDAPLNKEDLDDLRAGTKRVFNLMQDLKWHTPGEIKKAAGENSIPAMEGLRRLRELRQVGFEVFKMRAPGQRVWMYRLRRFTIRDSGDDTKAVIG